MESLKFVSFVYKAILIHLFTWQIYSVGCYDFSYENPPKAGWIDPFDMLGDGETGHGRSIGNPVDGLRVQSEIEIQNLKERCGKSEIYLRRFVNLFLRSSGFKDRSVSPNSENYIKMEFIINGKDLNILQEFGKNELGYSNLEFVSKAITNIFTLSTPSYGFRLEQLWNGFQKVVLKILNSPEWTVISTVSLMLFATMWFVYKTRSYRLAFFSLSLTVFFAGFGITWMRMYEEEEIKRFTNIRIYGDVPYHCSGKYMPWYEHLYYKLFGVDCYEFFKTRDIRPIVKVSPTEVLAQTFSVMIIKPAENIGKAYGTFIFSVNSDVPWYIKPLAVPLSFVIPPLFIISFLAMCFNNRISITWTGFHLMPSWYKTHTIESKQNNKYIEDFPKKENENLQGQNTLHSALSDSKGPVFLMNFQGLKKISKSNLFSNNAQENDSEVDSKVDSDSEELENSNPSELIKPIQKQKSRSILTIIDNSRTIAVSSDQNLVVDNDSNLVASCCKSPDSGNGDCSKEKTA